MGLSGLRDAESVGFTVPNLAEAHRFLVDVIGGELTYALGSLRADGECMQTRLTVHPRLVMRKVRLCRCDFGPTFELVVPGDPADGQCPQPRHRDLGGHHIVSHVDGIDDAAASLRERDVEVLGAPTARPNARYGRRWVCFLSLWGMRFERVSSLQSKAYERVDSTVVWSPARSAE